MKLIDNWSETSEKLVEKQISTKQLYDGVLLNAWKDEVKLPDGSVSHREYLKHPGASAILPVFEDGSVLLIGQYRYPLKQAFLEVPAGKLDSGEPPLDTAVRELKEETGLSAKQWHKVGLFHPCIGYSDEVIHIYTAWNLSESGINTDDDEFLSYHIVHFSEALAMVEDGSITDSKTIITLLRCKNWWDHSGPFNI